MPSSLPRQPTGPLTRLNSRELRRPQVNWNRWVRQSHRWISIAFTLAVIVNGIAVAMKKYTNALGLMAGVPLALLLLTGLYLFVLPYAIQRRSRGRAGRSG